MRTLRFALLSALMVTSSIADDRPLLRASTPIRLEGQIREVTTSDDGVTLHLHRQRYPILVSCVTRVCWLDGHRERPTDLQVGDSIRVEGNVQRNNVITADHVTILQRDEHRP